MGNAKIKNQYVVLTGGKNNAGDFLIKERGKDILKKFRPDRAIVEYNAWEKFSSKELKEVNSSRALILLGGPALQFSMRPSIYPMVGALSKINTPIISMGIGWKSLQGDWENSVDYNLNSETVELLNKINNSGFLSSVRDYRTLNVLLNKGMKNFVMTGCPALYDFSCIEEEFNKKIKIKTVCFFNGG